MNIHKFTLPDAFTMMTNEQASADWKALRNTDIYQSLLPTVSGEDV
jgi:hypothetical protein